MSTPLEAQPRPHSLGPICLGLLACSFARWRSTSFSCNSPAPGVR